MTTKSKAHPHTSTAMEAVLPKRPHGLRRSGVAETGKTPTAKKMYQSPMDVQMNFSTVVVASILQKKVSNHSYLSRC